jgi:predicted transcriptional regulator
MQRTIRYRSVSEITSSILKSIHRYTGATITCIQHETRIPYKKLKEHLTLLVQSKFIVFVSEEKKFRTTESGIHFLKLYGEMDSLLVFQTAGRSAESKLQWQL